jgi:SAM-dependent methyltransferase
VTADSGVRRYYDDNTWKFLLSSSERALHRELWGPGVADRAGAVHHVHALVLAELGPDDSRVLDLGCGVGTAALYLARRRAVKGVGVSISPEQVRLAQRYAERTPDLQGSARFVVADFTDLPDDLTGFDLAFAIESFVHATDPSAFFGEAAGALRPGGALVVVDDVLSDAGAASADPRLDDFRAGWHAPNLLTVEGAESVAAGHGLVLEESRDLSSMQRMARPRDRLVRAAQPVLRRMRGRSMWADSMVGGDALQRCHRAGLLEYRLLRFVRRGPRPADG